MPSTTNFTLQHILDDQFEVVYNSLLDLKKFGELHPHMTGVTIIQNKLPEYIEYNIIEEIYLFGFIRNHPDYNAKVLEIEKNKHIRYTSPVKKNIFLTVDFTFSKNGKGTLLVTEKIEIKSNKFMGMIFGGILKKAHLKFFDNLSKLLQNSVEDVSVK